MGNVNIFAIVGMMIYARFSASNQKIAIKVELDEEDGRIKDVDACEILAHVKTHVGDAEDCFVEYGYEGEGSGSVLDVKPLDAGRKSYLDLLIPNLSSLELKDLVK